jgi:hypothetical protein
MLGTLYFSNPFQEVNCHGAVFNTTKDLKMSHQNTPANVARCQAYTASKPASWHAARKQRWRLANPDKAKASRLRQQRQWRLATIRRRVLITWAIIQNLKHHPKPIQIMISRTEKAKYWVPVKVRKICANCGRGHYRRQSPCCSGNCVQAKWRSENRERYNANQKLYLAKRRLKFLHVEHGLNKPTFTQGKNHHPT